PAPDHVRVTVEDTGNGLTPEAARRMFDRFWRDDSAATGKRWGRSRPRDRPRARRSPGRHNLGRAARHGWGESLVHAPSRRQLTHDECDRRLGSSGWLALFTWVERELSERTMF